MDGAVWNGTSANTVTVAQPIGSGDGMVFHAGAGGVLRKEGQQTMRFTQPQGWVSLGINNSFGVNSYGIASDPVHNRTSFRVASASSVAAPARESATPGNGAGAAFGRK